MFKSMVARHGHRRKRGAAILEFAIVAPVLMTMLFGTIEFGQVFMVRQTAHHAAREAARLAVMKSTPEPYDAPGGPVVELVANILESAGVTFEQGMLDITTDTPTEGMVTVKITVPYSEIALTGYIGPIASEVSGSCTMRKEG